MINDDLAINNEYIARVTRVIKVTNFNKESRIKGNLFNRMMKWLFKIPSKREYYYNCILMLDELIFESGNTVSIKNMNMRVTDTDELSNIIWCSSLKWSNNDLDKKDFENKYVILEKQ